MGGDFSQACHTPSASGPSSRCTADRGRTLTSIVRASPASVRGARLTTARRALLAALSQHADFSVGCYCEDESRCHRSLLRALLAEQGARIVPS